MLRLLTDENFDGRITAGLLHLEPTLPLMRVQDVGLSGTDDPTVLAWAAAENRLLVTHDRKTIPGFAVARILAGQYPVLFNLDEATEVVTIVLVGEKQGNQLLVQGEEFTAHHESDPPE
jgi:predicted nuclease of predicted toxin-antitoxin system